MMDKIIVLLFFVGSLCAQDLYGVVKKNTLKKAPYKSWYKKGIRDYHPNSYVVKTIRPNLEGVTVKVFFGSWCPDSHREIPRFFKVLKLSGFNTKNVKLIALDRKKESNESLEEGYAILRVPTFIFYRKGKEIGRIVEQPMRTMEEDIDLIVTGK